MQIENSNFYQILRTLGASTIDLVEGTPEWDFWSAEFKTPVASVTGYYLYLKHKCRLKDATKESLLKWRDYSSPKGYDIVITPKSSLNNNISETNFSFKGKDIFVSKDMLQNNFLNNFKKIETDEIKYFVTPAIRLENGTDASNSITYLKSWFTGKNHGTKISPVSILIADGGIGKTTLSRMVCYSLEKGNNSIIPILIESDLWKNLFQSEITLETIWNLALQKSFDQPGPLISNETALRTLIQNGLFVVIFDGFDELCSSPSCPYSAQEILEKMTELTRSDDDSINSKILLTSRKTYWDSISDGLDLSEIEIFRLKGFDNKQRKDYFSKRLSNKNEIDIANRLAKHITSNFYTSVIPEEQNEDRPSGVPFVLDLIANYVQGNDDPNLNPYEGDKLEQLIIDICRRENIRQNLNIDSSLQIELFEELFREFQGDIKFEDLKFFIEGICNVEDPGIVSRFKSHSLLSYVGNDCYSPKYEVLRVYFIARFLAHGLSGVNKNVQKNKIAQILSSNSTGKTLVMDWVVRQLSYLSDGRLTDALVHARDIISSSENREYFIPSGKALYQLVNKFINENDKIERTNKLLKYYGSYNSNGEHIFRNVVFCEEVITFDLSNTRFEDCIFSDVKFKNCKFNKNTTFIHCKFDGFLFFERCQEEESVSLGNHNILSDESNLVFSQLKNIPSDINVKTKFAEESLVRALKKFKSNFGFKSIQYRHRLTGFKPGNPFNESIWKELLDHNIIEKHTISGVNEGGLNIADDKEVRREIINYLDNSILSKTLKAVVQTLIE